MAVRINRRRRERRGLRRTKLADKYAHGVKDESKYITIPFIHSEHNKRENQSLIFITWRTKVPLSLRNREHKVREIQFWLMLIFISVYLFIRICVCVRICVYTCDCKVIFS